MSKQPFIRFFSFNKVYPFPFYVEMMMMYIVMPCTNTSEITFMEEEEDGEDDAGKRALFTEFFLLQNTFTTSNGRLYSYYRVTQIKIWNLLWLCLKIHICDLLLVMPKCVCEGKVYFCFSAVCLQFFKKNFQLPNIFRLYQHRVRNAYFQL